MTGISRWITWVCDGPHAIWAVVAIATVCTLALVLFLVVLPTVLPLVVAYSIGTGSLWTLVAWMAVHEHRARRWMR
jgi:hypothetical protein